MKKIILGDCLEKLKELPDNSIDSIVTDPPYGIGFMGKEWDVFKSSEVSKNVEGSRRKGEHKNIKDGKDGMASPSGIRYDESRIGHIKFQEWCHKWLKETYRVLKPGGHILISCSTRMYHRMACATEDAGFEIRDMIEWVYGSGFPKSLNIGKAVDKLQGNKREKTGNSRAGSKARNGFKGDMAIMPFETKTIDLDITKGTSKWEGWGTALKPAHEPICMARKPLSEKSVAENCLKWGTGGINIDESRVGTGGDYTVHNAGVSGSESYQWNKGEQKESSKEYKETTGRFPANLIHDNSEEVRECFPDNSERFFKSIIYHPKASKGERNKGCEGLEEKPVAWGNQAKAELKRGNLDFRAGGDATKHNKVEMRINNHPTVKPIALMEYLIKMVTPKGGVVLDPFTGSGSTLVAAKQNGFDYIGIEKEEEYVKIAEARLKAVTTQESLI